MSEPGRASPIKRAASVAGLFLGVTAVLQLLSLDYIDAELARRLAGIMMGLIVVLYANSAPKQLTPLVVLRCSPAKEQAIRRFTGISLVLGGVGYALAWMLAPIAAANALGATLLGVSLLAVAIRYGSLFVRRPPG